MGSSLYPNELDSDLELPRVDNNLTEIGGDVVNALRDAIFAIESSIGVNPQGSMTDLVSRINGVIDEAGNIRSSAIEDLGLVSLPINNSHIDANAAIEETKLDLDFGTSSLNSRISSFNSDLDSVRNTLGAVSNQNTIHFSGINYKHDGYDINLTTTIRSAEDVETAINLVNNAFDDHVNDSLGSHNASSILLNNEFININADNVQDAIASLDAISVSSLAQNQDELRATSITSNDKGQQDDNGNLKETILASTIFQTNTASATNILQVMRPNVARVTGASPNLRLLEIGAIQNLRIEAGGIYRSPIDINLSSAISTQDIEDIIYVINTQCAAVHYPVSAYNVNGKLTIAHNIPGKEFTIQIKNDVSLSAHDALGFSGLTSTVFEWANNQYSVFINGERAIDTKSFIKMYHSHGGGSTIAPALGDLSLLGMTIGNEGRILCNITNHSSDPTYNGTYYIVSYPDNLSFTLSESVIAGSFDLEIPSDAVNFTNSVSGQIFDIFAEDIEDGYFEITKSLRVSYGTLSGVSIAEVNEEFPTDSVDWEITDDGEIQFIGIDNNGIPVIIPGGYTGDLKVYAPDNINSAIFKVTGNPAVGSRTVTLTEFSGGNDKLYLSSIHYSGNFGLAILKFVSDKRNFGGTIENYTNNIFTKTTLEELTDDLRNNGVIRGLDLISETDNSLYMRGGKAYVEGRALDVETQTVTVQDLSPSKKLLLLDRNGTFFVKSEFDSGYSFAELIEGDSYGDNRGVATILEFETDGESIIDGYTIDRRLLIGNIDKRVNDHVVDLNNRINQIQNVVAGSFWGNTISNSGDGAQIANVTVSGNSNLTVLDEDGFSAGNNLVTSRRFEFTNFKPENIFCPVGLTHINVFIQFDYVDNAGAAPFGTSGKFEVLVGAAVELGIDSVSTYEDYALVKTIDTDVLPSNTTIERYVVSIPLSELTTSKNVIFDIGARVKFTGSTYADGGSGGGVSPKIIFRNLRIVTSSYSIAGYILGEDGTSQSLATTVEDVL